GQRSHPGGQRQRAAPADDREDQGAAEGTGSYQADTRRQWLSQSGQRRALRGSQDRTADRAGALSPSCQLATAICRGSQIPARVGHADAEDGASAEDPTGKKTLCAAQTNPGARVRHHQIGDGISPMSVARDRKRQRRMESGDYELEHQANVRNRHWRYPIADLMMP